MPELHFTHDVCTHCDLIIAKGEEVHPTAHPFRIAPGDSLGEGRTVVAIKTVFRGDHLYSRYTFAEDVPDLFECEPTKIYAVMRLVDA